MVAGDYAGDFRCVLATAAAGEESCEQLIERLVGSGENVVNLQFDADLPHLLEEAFELLLVG